MELIACVMSVLADPDAHRDVYFPEVAAAWTRAHGTAAPAGLRRVFFAQMTARPSD